MKTTISLLAMLITTFSAVAISVAATDSDDSAFSVMETSATVQDEAVPPAPAAVQEPVAPVPVDPAVIQAPAEPGAVVPVPYDAAPADSVMMDSVVMGQPIMNAPIASGCNTCCQPTCCCPPKPMMKTFCLVDPCGCPHQANICVPGCCVGEEPCVTWKNGIFGRQIATVCWKCCDHDVKVVVTRRGKVKVRG